MCGLAGLWDRSASLTRDILDREVRSLGAALTHRGPDDAGTWVDEFVGLGLAFQRLAIIDTSPAGHQPMVSADGRWVLAFNGEVYDHLAVRRRLGRISFRGRSDTETLVEAIALWGLTKTLDNIDGMFAFAAWDRSERRLHLVRDRIGEKPMLYGWIGNDFVFASELTAFRRHPGFTLRLDPGATALYLRLGYIPAPHTIDQAIRKLPAGHLLSLDGHGSESVRPYWRLADVIDAGASARQSSLSLEDATQRLDDAVLGAVRSRVDADVPVGAFLSSGIDSSAVVAAMAAVAPGRVSTFTVDFPDAAVSETAGARAVAEALGTDHHELVVREHEGVELVPTLASLYDEPFADPAAISTVLISRAARREVTVCLSGDGGDELFGGYRRYQRSQLLARRASRLPRPARAAAGSISRHVPRLALLDRWRDAIAKAGEAVGTAPLCFGAVAARWTTPSAVLASPADAPRTAFDDPSSWPELDELIEQMMYVDCALSLPEQMLTKVDRGSMSCSLEVRVPLIAPGVVETAWSLPFERRVGNEPGGKAVLRQVVARRAPIATGHKLGFDPPLGRWLRGDLRDWAETLLAPAAIRANGVLDPTVANRLWQDVVAGRERGVSRLWSLLMLESWLGQ